MLTACFFCRTNDPGILDRVDFYAQDLRILKDLGFDVRIATQPSQLVPADLYFAWWWTWAFVPVAYARLRGKPVIVTGTFDLWMFNERPLTHRLLHRLALRTANANVFISELELKAVSSAYSTCNPLYVPLGVDTQKLTPSAAQRERFALTIAGSGMDQGNSSRKCIPELIRSAPLIHREHPDLRFVIVGKKGSDYPMLQELARDVGADSYIEFPGVVSEQEKISLLQTCAIYLQPSRHEGFGLSVLEAMSCGAPVVTNAAGALPEVGGDAVRYAAEPSPEAVATTVNSLLSDPFAQTALSRAARKRAATLFSIDRRREDVLRIVESLLETRLGDNRNASAPS